MDKSEELGVRLHGLYRAGSVTLPIIANQFVEANGKVELTQSKTKEAFTQLNGDVSQVCDAWTELRNQLQTFTGNSGKHTHEMAEGVIELMNQYAETDCAAADELERLKEKDIKYVEDKIGELTMPDDVPEFKDPVFP